MMIEFNWEASSSFSLSLVRFYFSIRSIGLSNDIQHQSHSLGVTIVYISMAITIFRTVGYTSSFEGNDLLRRCRIHIDIIKLLLEVSVYNCRK